MSLALKKTLTHTNIRARFRGIGIWPLNLEAMQNKMGPSEQFLPQSVAEDRVEEDLNQEIIEEGIPPSSPNAIHYYVNSMEDEDGLDIDEDVEEPYTQNNISNFLRLPQEVVTTRRYRAEPLVDYSQSQILTLVEHVNILHNSAEKKDQLLQEKDARRVERKFTKHTRALEKKKKRETKEKDL